MRRKLANGVVTIVLLSACAVAQSQARTTGTVHGTVSIVDDRGVRSVIPSVTVSLTGLTNLTVQTDDQGNFSFDSLSPGYYAISAESTDMAATRNIAVQAGTVSEASLEMRLVVLAQSTTVTASTDQVDPKEAAGRNTVGESAVRNMPNIDEHFQSLLPLVPGVVLGPNGLINMKGAHASESGSLVNSMDVTDPATGEAAINIPIDVVSSIQVLSTPYDPEYGKFTGAVSNVETKPGDFDKLRVSAQNFLPRFRRLDGSIMGIAAFTPRVTFSGPIVKDRVAFTQSFEYRYERNQVYSLPALQSDSKSELFDSYTQLDFNINKKQTATASFAIFPQKLDYYGLNTFTPQLSTPDLHERGYQANLQDRYITNSGDLLTSQLSFSRFNADVLPNSGTPYELLPETTKGGFFNRQHRDTSRTEWKEIFRSHPHHFLGTHELDAGMDFAHSTYDGREQFLPIQIIGVAGYPLERINFGPTAAANVDQEELAWFAGDKWTVSNRLTFDLGLRFDRDSITDPINTAPRAGFVLSLTGDGKTLFKGGAGFFYNRVPLDVPAFPYLPDRTVETLDPAALVLASTEYANVIPHGIRNPRSEVWNLEVDRQVTADFLLRAGYQQRNTVHEFFLNPISLGPTGMLSLSSAGSDIYKEFQVTGRYRIHHSTLNASYVRSFAYGELNDFNQLFGNDPQALIQPNQRGHLNFDTPNRILAWGEIALPWKLTFAPVVDSHTGFPYSTVDQYRHFVGPRNERRFPRFVSTDLQVWREIRLPKTEKHARIGFGVFNLFNHPNYRDVQNDLESYRFGEFFNGPARTFHGKFVLEF